METNIQIFKCYFKLITWNNGTESCYAYTTTPSYSCTFKLNGETHTSNISVRMPNAEKNKNAPQITKWLSDEQGKAYPKDIADLHRQEYGDIAYFKYDTEQMSFELINQQEFDSLTAEQQATLGSSTHAFV